MTLPADPERLRSPWRVRFFGGVMARQMRADFHAVRISKPGVPALPPRVPAVIYCNHPSWWDPAFLAVLSTHVFTTRLCYGPVDAAAMQQYGFMRRVGFFPVHPGSRSGAVALLRIGGRLLDRNNSLLWITPEGTFTDVRQRPIELRRGLAGLLTRARRVTVLPMALEYPFWSERKPEALARFGTALHLSKADAPKINELHGVLERRLTETMDALAQDASSKDAARFVTLLEGASGVGGVYDAWRRTKAWSHGRRFEASHAPDRVHG